jgi:hypothetical protein
MRFRCVIFLMFLSSCIDNSIPELVPDVYIAGNTRTVINGLERSTATFWKNGEQFKLPGGIVGSQANVIKVSGDDIFIAGTIYDDYNTNIPVLWKNGEFIQLALPDSMGTNCMSWVSSLEVNGSDVYIGGAIDKNDDNTINTTAVLWKNGQLIELSNAYNKQVTSISISGEDVFVGRNDGYWKNGVFIPVRKAGHLSYLGATQLAKGDVFNAGTVYTPYNYDIAVFWKNDSSIFMNGGENFDSSKGIFIEVSEDGVHLVGYIFNSYESSDKMLIGYWKNGNLEKLLGSHGTEVKSLTVFERNVYISGKILDERNNSLGVYWVNGKTLGIPGSEVINSIFVK